MQVLVLLSRVTLLSLMVVVVRVEARRQAPFEYDELKPSDFATISDERRQQVMSIGPGDSPGSLAILTRHQLVEFDADGRRRRVVRFPDELWLPSVTSLQPGGSRRIVGLRSRFILFRSSVDVLTLGGERIGRLPAADYSQVEVADVWGDEDKEILTKYSSGVVVADARGRRIGMVRAPRYLYHARTIGIAGEPKRAIAMWMWRDNERGTDISVRRANGTEIGSWNENPSDRLAVFALDGNPEGIWSAVNGAIVERSPAGAVRRTFDLPGLRNFRYLHGGNVAGRWKVIVGFLGKYGDLVGRMLFVFNPEGKLVARDYSPYPSWAFYIPDANGTTFFLSAGDRVLKYDVSSLVSIGR